MIQSAFSRKVIISFLLAATIFISTAWGQSTDTTDSRDLLKMMRQETGDPAKPAYAERTEESKTDELLKMIPAESLFVLRINSFENSLNQMDQFLAGVSPLGLRMMVHMQLGGILGNPELAGVNMNGDFAIFGLPGASSQDVLLAILVPVTDYQQFVNDNMNVGQPEEKGISKIKLSESVSLVSIQLGNSALISESPDKLLKIADMISAVKDNGFAAAMNADQVVQAASTPIWACGNMQNINKAYGSLLDAQLANMKYSMQGIPQQGMDPMAMMNIYFDIIKKVMAETKFIAVNIDPKPNVLNITETIIALPGTEMVSMLTASASSTKNSRALGYLKNGSAFNFMANMDTPLNKKMNDFGIDLLFALLSEKIGQEDKAKIKQLTTDLMDSLGQTAICSVAADTKNKPPFAGEYIIEVKDAKEFNSLTDQAIELVKSLGILDFYKQMGMQADFSMNRNTDTYNGVSIDSMKFSMKAVDTNSPENQMAAQIIEQMYGQGLEYRLAMVGDLCVCTIGGDPDASIRSLIDKVKSGEVKPLDSEIQTALELIPGAGEADFFGTVNLLRYFEMIKSMMAFLPIPPIEIPQSSSNIVFAAKADSGNLTLNIALPKQHISEIFMTIMTAQQQIMQQQQMMMQEQMQQQKLPSDQNMRSTLKWTCPMHSEVMMAQSGKCPICGMDMVPVSRPVPIQKASSKPRRQLSLHDSSKPQNDREKRASTKADMQILQSAVMQFKMDIGSYPADLRDLIEKTSNVDNYPEGGYVDANEVPKDGWGNEFRYEVSPDYTRGFLITSYGADNQEGGEGFASDICTDPQAMKRKQKKQQP